MAPSTPPQRLRATPTSSTPAKKRKTVTTKKKKVKSLAGADWGGSICTRVTSTFSAVFTMAGDPARGNTSPHYSVYLN